MSLYKKKATVMEIYTEDPTIFAGLELPDPITVQQMTGLILTECRELDTIFSDAAGMAAYLPIWNACELPGWERIAGALEAEYDPLHNYDRTETETETVEGDESGSESSTGTRSGTGSESTTGTSSSSSTRTGSNSETVTGSGSGTATASGTTTREQKTAGFNSADYEAADKEIVTPDTTSETETESSTSTSSEDSGAEDVDTEMSTTRTTGETVTDTGSKQESRTRDETRERTLHSYGNIGVTTAQQMITAELELRTRWTLAGVILESFKRTMCVGVW